MSIRVHSWKKLFSLAVRLFIVGALLLAAPPRLMGADLPTLSREELLKQADGIADAQIKAVAGPLKDPMPSAGPAQNTDSSA